MGGGGGVSESVKIELRGPSSYVTELSYAWHQIKSVLPKNLQIFSCVRNISTDSVLKTHLNSWKVQELENSRTDKAFRWTKSCRFQRNFGRFLLLLIRTAHFRKTRWRQMWSSRDCHCLSILASRPNLSSGMTETETVKTPDASTTLTSDPTETTTTPSSPIGMRPSISGRKEQGNFCFSLHLLFRSLSYSWN